MNELALFAGAGGGILGGHLLGWRCVCAVEIDEYARRVLIERQNDRSLRPFPIWDDITTFDGRPWAGHVDVVTGGFPCQDISCAGGGGGIEGSRSGLWKHMARIVGEVRPAFVLVENSPLLVSRGLAVVLGDLAEMGFDAIWGVVGAHHAGAPHKRDRIWVLAHAVPTGQRWNQRKIQAKTDAATMADPISNGRKSRGSEPEGFQGGFEACVGGSSMANASGVGGEGQQCLMGGIGESGQRREDCPKDRVPWIGGDPANQAVGSESFVGRVADGVAHRVDRLRCIGNGQVPAVVRLAWETLNHIKP